MNIPMIKGKLFNHTKFSTNSLRVKVQLDCIGWMGKNCGTWISESAVNADGTFSIAKKKGKRGNQLSYSIIQNGSVIFYPGLNHYSEINYYSEKDLIKNLSVISLYTIPAGKLSLKLDNGWDLDTWLKERSPGRGLEINLFVKSKDGSMSLVDGLYTPGFDYVPLSWKELNIAVEGNSGADYAFDVSSKIKTSYANSGGYQDEHIYSESLYQGVLKESLPQNITHHILQTKNLNLSIEGSWSGSLILNRGVVSVCPCENTEAEIALVCQNGAASGEVILPNGFVSPISGSCSEGNGLLNFKISVLKLYGPETDIVDVTAKITSIWNGLLKADIVETKTQVNMGWIDIKR